METSEENLKLLPFFPFFVLLLLSFFFIYGSTVYPKPRFDNEAI